MAETRRDAGGDERPPIWIGHVLLHTPDLGATREFMIELGMRDIAKGDDFAVLELRGGTHLVLLPAESGETPSGPAPFDLMVPDLDAAYERLRAAGRECSDIATGQVHRSFTVRSPSGHDITFNSDHSSDLPV